MLYTASCDNNTAQNHLRQEGDKKLIEETYEGIPRNKIPWHPIIDYEKCITCGKCVDYCHNRAFEFEEKDGKKRTVVKKPNNCVVFCRGCEDICPVSAIAHPSEKATQKLIQKLKKAKK